MKIGTGSRVDASNNDSIDNDRSRWRRRTGGGGGEGIAGLRRAKKINRRATAHTQETAVITPD